GGSLGDALHLGPFWTADRNLFDVQFKFQRADRQLVAVVQFLLAGHTFAVEIGAVLAAEVTNGEIIALEDQGTMVAADQVALRTQLAILRAAHKELRTNDFDLLTLSATNEH